MPTITRHNEDAMRSDSRASDGGGGTILPPMLYDALIVPPGIEQSTTSCRECPAYYACLDDGVLQSPDQPCDYAPPGASCDTTCLRPAVLTIQEATDRGCATCLRLPGVYDALSASCYDGRTDG